MYVPYPKAVGALCREELGCCMDRLIVLLLRSPDGSVSEFQLPEVGAITEAGIEPPEMRDLLKSRAISKVPLKASPQG